MCKANKPMFTGAGWTVDLVEKMWEVIDDIAVNEYGLEYNDPQIEIVTSDQMLHHHSMNAMPTGYNHWSYGKRFEISKREYEAGRSSIAYETIINTDPMICYIMEDNSATMQALVLAHANCGHGDFFKRNYMFKEWTDPKAVLNELKYSKEFIKDCELKYGPKRVERILDAAHSLSLNGIDRYKRRRIKRKSDEDKRKKDRAKYLRQSYDTVLDKTIKKTKYRDDMDGSSFNWPFPEENLLYFVEKHSLGLEDWEKDIVRIVRKSAQYFYPQMMTKVMNEGWASFWHYTLMERLYDLGHLTEGSLLEFYDSHTAVCNQPDMSNMNPYVLGFNIFMDLKRACENPTEEDYEYLPLVAGKPWLETLKWVAENFKDSDFILECLGPQVIKKLKLFSIKDDTVRSQYTVLSVQTREDIQHVKDTLSKQYTLDELVPTINIVGYNFKGDRMLSLEHEVNNGRTLHRDTAIKTVKYLMKLWKNPVMLSEYDKEGNLVNAPIKRKYV